MSSVSIQAVSRIFEGHKGQRTQALLPVDFEVRDNDFVTILGPSGCGKSTLLRMVAGLEAISGGALCIGGEMVNDLRAQGQGHRDGFPELRAVSAHDRF